MADTDRDVEINSEHIRVQLRIEITADSEVEATAIADALEEDLRDVVEKYI